MPLICCLGNFWSSPSSLGKEVLTGRVGELLVSVRTEDGPLGSVPAEARLLVSRGISFFLGALSSSDISVTVALYLLTLLIHENIGSEDNMRTRQCALIAGPGLFPLLLTVLLPPALSLAPLVRLLSIVLRSEQDPGY